MLAELGDFYPGSKERRAVNHVPGEVNEEPDLRELGQPRKLFVRVASGAEVEVEFWGIGVLAAVLNRQPVTIRAWEKDGIIPRPTFSKPGRDRDPRGRRRLYTERQILGIRQIALEEGVLEPGPRINILKTQFKERVTALFEELRREELR